MSNHAAAKFLALGLASLPVAVAAQKISHLHPNMTPHNFFTDYLSAYRSDNIENCLARMSPQTGQSGVATKLYCTAKPATATEEGSITFHIMKPYGYVLDDGETTVSGDLGIVVKASGNVEAHYIGGMSLLTPSNEMVNLPEPVRTSPLDDPALVALAGLPPQAAKEITVPAPLLKSEDQQFLAQMMFNARETVKMAAAYRVENGQLKIGPR
jgi:hypothetical protein